jgi:hypothetical protein
MPRSSAWGHACAPAAAVVNLHGVKSPLGERVGVLLIMAPASAVAAANRTGVGVDAGQQLPAVDVAGQPPHPVWPERRVELDRAVGVARAGRAGASGGLPPARVDPHVAVARRLEAALDRGVGQVDDGLLVDAEAVAIPGVHAHVRRGVRGHRERQRRDDARNDTPCVSAARARARPPDNERHTADRRANGQS